MVQKITKESFWVRNIILGFFFLLAFLWVVNPTSRSAVGINLIFLVICFVSYRAIELQDDLIGVKSKNSGLCVAYGVLATFSFYLVTLFVPGMSIGYPSLPASISDSLKFFLVVIVAPIVESIFFQGALYAYVHNFGNGKKKYRWIAIFVQAIAFSMFHIGAYVTGFYNYPGFTEGMSAIYANISGFIVAFVFALIAGIVVTANGVKNLIFAIVFHLGINLVSYSLSVAVYLISLSLGASYVSSLALIPLTLVSYKLIKRRKDEIKK